MVNAFHLFGFDTSIEEGEVDVDVDVDVKPQPS